MSDINTDHYPDMAEDELYERREALLNRRRVHQCTPVDERRIRIELIHIADALDRGIE